MMYLLKPCLFLGLAAVAGLSLSLVHATTTIQGDPNTEYNEYDFNGMERARIVNTSGKITISPMLTTRVTIAIYKHKFSDHCSTEIQRNNLAMLVVEVKQPSGETCDADIEMRVPPAIDLDVTAGSGQVNVAGLKGALKFKLASGELVADGHIRNIDGKSGSGSVEIKGLAGGGNVDVGSGKVNLSFVDEAHGQINVKAGSGDTTLLFPKGTKIKAALNTGSGELANELGDSSDAGFSVSAKTGSGDLSVKSY